MIRHCPKLTSKGSFHASARKSRGKRQIYGPYLLVDFRQVAGPSRSTRHFEKGRFLASNAELNSTLQLCFATQQRLARLQDETKNRCPLPCTHHFQLPIHSFSIELFSNIHETMDCVGMASDSLLPKQCKLWLAVSVSVRHSMASGMHKWRIKARNNVNELSISPSSFS